MGAAKKKAATAASVRAELRALGKPKDALFMQRYFKTGPGEYAEGDRFLGIRVPVLRAVVARHRDLPFAEAVKLLKSGEHEARLVALLILVELYRRGDGAAREAIYDAYLANTEHIDNWDLVDLSAPQIVGAHLDGKSKAPLTRLARSADLWERRIAILATLHLIRQGSFGETLRIAKILLRDPHDLIHKAAGWMLREVGNKDRAAEIAFLRVHQRVMPRTMLRYAIEKFPEPERKRFLAGTG